MLKIHFKSAIRNLWKNKVFSAISIGGLSISLAAVLLILLWVDDERKVDTFGGEITNLHRLFIVDTLADGSLKVSRSIPYPLVQEAADKIPDANVIAARDYPLERFFQLEEKLYKARGSNATISLLEAFPVEILAGSLEASKSKTNSIVITEDFAAQLFGKNWSANAIGATLLLNRADGLEITAVCENPPNNSTIQFEYLINLAHHIKKNDWLLDWGSSALSVYINLNDHAQPAIVKQKLDGLIAKSEIAGVHAKLQVFSEGYLYGKFDEMGQASGGRIEYVRIFSIAALFLLLIACINFVNLATARANRRAKEVGVRKTIGASRWALVKQFMSEAFFITFLSIGIAILLAQLALPWLSQLTDKELHFAYTSPAFWLFIAAIIGVTSLLAGTYPAFVLSAFRPVQVLKGKLTARTQKVNLRKMLVVVQFTLAALLILFALLVQQQIHFIKNTNLGLDRENIISIYKDEILSEKYDIIKKELLKESSIQDVTVTGNTPIDLQSSTTGIKWEGKQEQEQNTSFKLQWADYNYLDIFKIPLADGRFYEEAMQSDSTALVINETAAEVMGMENAVGKTVNMWGTKRQIVGVVKDFHNQSLHESVAPMLILLDPENTWSLFVKTEPGATSAAIAALQRTSSSILPDYQLEYEFLDEAYERKYRSEIVTGQLVNYFALISILISCLGLLGLATFLTQQRTKEIGIRKVLGASVASIIGLLSKDFIALILLAILIASPIAWYGMNQWLENFAYHVQVQWWLFGLTALAAVTIALLTIGIQSLKAALANPVKSLRNE
ncbi:MAG: ABC transporter permease [Bacteroidota bacterium]